MKITAEQLERIAEFAMECHEGFGHEPAKFYFYQNEEMNDSAISMHIHTENECIIIQIDEKGDMEFHYWW